MKRIILFLLLALAFNFANAQLAIKKSQDTLNSLERRLNTLTVYNNNKLDSIINLNNPSSVSATITSVNTGTAVTNFQTIGSTGVYSLTLPTGSFVISNCIITSSLQTSSDAFRVYIFNGSQNFSTYAEGATFNPSINEMSEFKTLFLSTSASMHFTTNSGRGMNILYPFGINTDEETHVMVSGTLKFGFTYNASFTPAANNVYYVRFELTRIR